MLGGKLLRGVGEFLALAVDFGATRGGFPKTPGFGKEFGVACGEVLLTCGDVVIEAMQGLFRILPSGKNSCGGSGGLLVGFVQRGDAGFEIIDCGFRALLIQAKRGNGRRKRGMLCLCFAATRESFR